MFDKGKVEPAETTKERWLELREKMEEWSLGPISSEFYDYAPKTSRQKDKMVFDQFMEDLSRGSRTITGATFSGYTTQTNSIDDPTATLTHEQQGNSEIYTYKYTPSKEELQISYRRLLLTLETAFASKRVNQPRDWLERSDSDKEAVLKKLREDCEVPLGQWLRYELLTFALVR